MSRPQVAPGPWLLRSPDPGLPTHRRLYGPVPDLSLAQLLSVIEDGRLRGRGGAGFPFATKLRATAVRRTLRRHLVVNLSEGEPASAKDVALAITAPHLILDGAALTAAALGVREIHLVAAGEHAWTTRGLARAIAERAAAGEDRGREWRLHTTEPRFVSGESSAVLELLQGRPNLPVTTWKPTAVEGLRRQPTLLSNAETFAQVGALVLAAGQVPGTAHEPGTRLLSLTRNSGPIQVVEVPHGTPWSAVLTAEELANPVLLGGYHGSWAPAGALAGRRVSAHDLEQIGLGLGAGIVLPLPAGSCPLERTASITRYLANQSAGRCGPCFRGLPALADAFEDFLLGGPLQPVAQISGMVEGRGACAHPDGTSRLVRSALTVFAEEVAAHTDGDCVAHPRPERIPA